MSAGGRMGMGFGQQQRMSQRPSPSLIQFTEILQMTGQELETLIEQALTENPALEVREMDRCPACGDVLLRDGSCYRCRRGDSLADAAARQVAEDPDTEEEFDVWRTVADQQSLAEHLLHELGAVIDDADLPIAEFLVGELDERGFLDIPLSRVAASLKVEEARAELVLRALQDVGPLGVGARSTEECLRLQLARWEAVGEGHPLARAIVDEHLEALGRGQYAQIAQALGADYDAVIDARDYIRSHLRPYPISERADVDPWERDTEPGASAPDVIIRDTEEGYLIEVVGSRRYGLSLNPVYRDLAVGGEATIVAHEEEPEVSDAHLSDDERDHVRTQVDQARQFLTHVRERRETMRRVTAYVVRRQRAFLARGPRHLQPLTRAQVAEALDLHESTISRATAGKWVMLPNRQVVPYATFFTPALRVHDVLRELVENEEKPLTDQQLVELLTERGFPIARRTVAKYRKQMNILPSSLR